MEELSFQEVIMELCSAFAELSGEELAEVAELHINDQKFDYYGDGIFNVTKK